MCGGAATTTGARVVVVGGTVVVVVGGGGGGGCVVGTVAGDGAGCAGCVRVARVGVAARTPAGRPNTSTALMMLPLRAVPTPMAVYTPDRITCRCDGDAMNRCCSPTSQAGTASTRPTTSPTETHPGVSARRPELWNAGPGVVAKRAAWRRATASNSADRVSVPTRFWARAASVCPSRSASSPGSPRAVPGGSANTIPSPSTSHPARGMGRHPCCRSQW
jgi:hypothetical protein